MELPEIGKEVERLLSGDPSGRTFRLATDLSNIPHLTVFAYYGIREQQMELSEYSNLELERAIGTMQRALDGDSVLSNDKRLRVSLKQDESWIVIYVGL